MVSEINFTYGFVNHLAFDSYGGRVTQDRLRLRPNSTSYKVRLLAA